MHENIVAAPELAGEDLQKIEWVRRNMPILRKIQSEFEKEQPFAGSESPSEFISKQKRHFWPWY